MARSRPLRPTLRRKLRRLRELEALLGDSSQLDSLLGALGVATTPTTVDPQYRWEAHERLAAFLRALRGYLHPHPRV